MQTFTAYIDAASMTMIFAAVAGVAFLVVKYLEKKKYDEYLDELCDCDCDCDCLGDDECCCDDCCDCCCDETVEVETEEEA